MDKHITAGLDHPLWTSFDDDDWNGATCSQWILGCKDKEVILLPPKDIDADLLARIRKSISNYAKSVEVR